MISLSVLLVWTEFLSVHSTEDQYRLVNGTSLFNGRVEVNRFKMWGTIADFGFETTAALVLCRSLGYSGGKIHSKAYYGMGTGPVWFKNIECTGDEYSLSACSNSPCPECGHANDVGVECLPSNVKFRLRNNSPDVFSGTVEVFYNWTWGTICDNNDMSNNPVDVICRSLGYSGGIRKEFSVEKSRKDIQPIWMDYLFCIGSEYSLLGCNYRAWGNNKCNHSQDLVVKCDPPDGCRACVHKQTCNSVADTCTCKFGWTGKSCDTDINECQAPDIYVCPENTTCRNTDGSFYCQLNKTIYKNIYKADVSRLAYVVGPMGFIVVILIVALVISVRRSKTFIPKQSVYKQLSEPEDSTSTAGVVNNESRAVGTAEPIRRSTAVLNTEERTSRAVEHDVFEESDDGYSTFSQTEIKSVDGSC